MQHDRKTGVTLALLYDQDLSPHDVAMAYLDIVEVGDNEDDYNRSLAALTDEQHVLYNICEGISWIVEDADRVTQDGRDAAHIAYQALTAALINLADEAFWAFVWDSLDKRADAQLAHESAAVVIQFPRQAS
jgi:hypothetical protein